MTKEFVSHKPSDAFRASLENQIQLALRKHPARVAAVSRRLLLAAVAASLAVGFVMGSAPAQLQNTQEKAAVIAVTQQELRLAEMWRTLAREQWDLANQRSAAGIISKEGVDSLRAELSAAEAKVRIAQLNLEEVNASGRPVRDDLIAPLVSGRDFVRERLEPQLSIARIRLGIAEHNLHVVKSRFDVGVSTGIDLLEAEMALARVESTSGLLVTKMDLRTLFLANRISASVLETRVQLFELRSQLREAQQKLRMADENLRITRSREATGIVTRAVLLRAELEVLELTALIEQLNIKIRQLSG